MAEPAKRKPWQIHLSTAIVLMFVAGFLLWLNFTPGQRFDPQRGINLPETNLGWPLPIYGTTVFERNMGFLRAAIVADVMFALICLTFAAKVCEGAIEFYDSVYRD